MLTAEKGQGQSNLFLVLVTVCHPAEQASTSGDYIGAGGRMSSVKYRTFIKICSLIKVFDTIG
jgi:hypothetical protein